MKVLFLGNGGAENDVLKTIIEHGGDEICIETEAVSLGYLEDVQPDIIVSYNYRHILKPDALNFPKQGTYNLHISFLPWNKGADPNFWSFAEGTPKGVTIHEVDEGVDTGDIVAQREVTFSGTETLASSYALLHREIQSLFKDNWPSIREGSCAKRSQDSTAGTLHKKKDLEPYKDMLEKQGWNTPVASIAALNVVHTEKHA